MTRDETLRKLVKDVAVLAERLDHLEASLSDWDAEPLDPREDPVPDQTFAYAPANEIAPDGREFIQMPEDWATMNEDQRGAWLRAAADKGEAVNAEDGKTEVIVRALADGSQVEFPAPSPEAKAAWDADADDICSGVAPSSGLTPATAAEAYRLGGPLWLSAWDHEYMMGLPWDWRVAMVEQINWYAPLAAKDLGRDILRQDTQSSQSWALQSATTLKEAAE